MDTTEARDLLAGLLHRIAPEADLGLVDPGAQLQEELDFLNLMTAREDATGIDVPEREYPLLSTIDGFVT